MFLNTKYEIVNDKLVIKYAFSKLIIAIEDIKEIEESTYYTSQDNNQYSIGMQNGQPDRIIIKTKDNKSYFISLNGSHILVNKIRRIKPNINIKGMFI
ncbi:SunI/YnzG family protein [Tepidibacter mesophilus]|uniref:SunI/YnzG family protein n=1 Tax=Tepidibacter mesophilus TaxID=655607 RepID=UPI000C08AD85|nr:PH domain-containing protein [Tepidibacter mesophilus]